MNVDISAVRLPDSAFWGTGDRDPGLDPIVEKYKTEYFGVLIDGPGEVNLENHAQLPLFAYYMGSYKQSATRDFPQRALVVVVDPDRNELRVAKLLRENAGEKAAPGPHTPPAELPDGWVMTFQRVDARARTEMPWAAGRAISQVLLLDLASNRVETKLTPGGGFVDLEKEKFLARERAKLDPHGPYPNLPVWSYSASPESPPLPEKPGISLGAPRVVAIDGKERLYLRGSWRLPVLPEELVKKDHAAYNKAHGLLYGETDTPYAACVRIHLVIVRSAQEEPEHIEIWLPVIQVLDEGKSATGRFNIDLLQLPGFEPSDETIFIYAYAKDWAAEPVTVGVVDRRPGPFQQ